MVGNGSKKYPAKMKMGAVTYTGDVEMSCYGKPKDKPDAAPDLFEWLFVAKTEIL